MGYTPNEMLNIVQNSKEKIVDYDKGVPFKLLKIVFTKKLNIKGFVKGKKLEDILKLYAKKKGIESIKDIKVPLAIPIVNLVTGGVIYCLSNDITIKQEKHKSVQSIKKSDSKYVDSDSYKNDGYIWDIVRASCSFPGVFVPKTIDGKIYIDGGVRANTPIEILRKMGATKIISISFDCNNINPMGIKNIIGISNQSFNIMSHEANESNIESADINIRICLDDTSLLDFSNPIYVANKGQQIVQDNIEMIKEKLGLI